MKRIVIALAAIGLFGVGVGVRSAKAQYYAPFGGGYNPYGFGGGYNPYGYGYGYGGYGWNAPQTYNQLGFLAGTVDQMTRQPRRYNSAGFPSRGVRPRGRGRRNH